MLSYLISLRSELIGHVTQKLIGPNETEVQLGPKDGLRANQNYAYTVTAINVIGNASSKWREIIDKSE